MPTNTGTNAPNGNGDERRPVSTDVVIPGETVIIDHWVVSSGSAVRAKETIAFVRKRSDGSTNDTSTTAVTVTAPKHKRPSRRKKGAKVQAKTDKQSNQTNNGSSSASAAKSTTIGLINQLLATKNDRKVEPFATTNQSGEDSETKRQENQNASISTPTLATKVQENQNLLISTSTVATKAKETMPIHAPATGILRIYSSSTKNEDGQLQRSLVIGVIEACQHPAFIGGMCVVCGAPRASIKDDKNSRTTTKNDDSEKTSQVTVSGGITMTISQRESENMAMFDSNRLLKQKKLSLVLDLDHTLVHATSDARAIQYLDPAHPLAVTAGDLRIISLPMFEGADTSVKARIDPRHKFMRSQHYVKLRPYVKEFLEGAQDMYEVSVYTAGTRQYAEEIAMVLCRKLAGSAIDSDELERLRQQVKHAEDEFEQPPRKKKRVSFQISEAVETNGETENNNSITKQKLETMQEELRSAERLELKARELRQKIFGSRIVSRTDVGDLGRDVKSLKRVFPCGGTMAAVVDDREDVWANAKDNSKRTIKGEPPDNLLLVRPYHWQPFVGFADINNAAGRDLSGSGPINVDRQLLWTKGILDRLHRRYYQQNSEGNRKTVPELLKQMRREVLMGSNIVLSGLVPLHKQSNTGATARPHFVRYTQNLGAKIEDVVNHRVTHVIAAKDGTDKALSARKIPGCMLVKSAWLMECFWSMTRQDATPFLMHKVTPGVKKSNIQPMQNVLRESNIENSSEGSTNDSDDDDDFDDDFAAEFESELMDMA